MDLFRVEYFIDDKRLGESLRRLAGLARGTPSVVPVINATTLTDDKQQQQLVATSSGRLVDLFSNHLTTDPPEDGVVNAAYARIFLKSIGRSVGNANYVMKQARDAGILKRNTETGRGMNTTYRIVK